MKKWIKEYITRFTYAEKRKRKLAAYMQEIERMKQMGEQELAYEYMETKTELEYKRAILPIQMLIIAFIMVGSICLASFFAGQIMQLQYVADKPIAQYVAGMGGNISELIKISLVLDVYALVFVEVIALYRKIEVTREIKKLRKKFLIIEEVRHSVQTIPNIRQEEE